MREEIFTECSARWHPPPFSKTEDWALDQFTRATNRSLAEEIRANFARGPLEARFGARKKMAASSIDSEHVYPY